MVTMENIIVVIPTTMVRKADPQLNSFTWVIRNSSGYSDIL